MRLHLWGCYARGDAFQFTHPGKGATILLVFIRVAPKCFNSRTLGRVRPYPPPYFPSQCSSFNSRTLGRVRLHRQYNQEFPFFQFQFTHPGKGATTLRPILLDLYQVSIHAPWEGCDLSFALNLDALYVFQFTHPGKGATHSAYASTSRMRVFQFTHPGKGATSPRIDGDAEEEFQFTHPGKGATRCVCRVPTQRAVSIHAPWEGCDSVVQSCVL